jgi:O-antigen ligase
MFIILLILLGSVYATTDYVISQTYLGKRVHNLWAYGSGTASRIELYQEGFDMIRKHPVLGVGLGQFRTLSSSGLYSHSDYIEVAANTGIIGFALYFSIYVVLWLRLNRIKRKTDDPHLLYIIGFFKAAIITILLVAFGRPNITSKLTWIFMAGAIGYSWSIERAFLMKAKHIKRIARRESVNA